ncbi:MAG TPA: hypothetical protein VM555_00915 [Tahibacter sp.]|nr:hypothetical protein [Tahibacter sp.]
MFTLKHLGAAALGTMLAASAYAGADKPAAQTAEPAAQSAMRAYVDPETGRLVGKPVTEQQARAAAADAGTFSADPAKVTRVDHANGMRQYKLNGQADEALVAVVRADGSLEYRCSEHGVVAGQPHDFAKETRNDR